MFRALLGAAMLAAASLPAAAITYDFVSFEASCDAQLSSCGGGGIDFREAVLSGTITTSGFIGSLESADPGLATFFQSVAMTLSDRFGNVFFTDSLTGGLVQGSDFFLDDGARIIATATTLTIQFNPEDGFDSIFEIALASTLLSYGEGSVLGAIDTPEIGGVAVTQLAGDDRFIFATANATAVPLPAGLPLLAGGLAALALLRRRRGA